jgi:hypothetical protein
VEFECDRGSERIVAPFHDANAVPDILALIELVAMYPECWSDEELYVFPTLQGALAEAEDRLRDKVSRTENPIRRRLFEAALASVGQARVLIAQECVDDARTLLDESARALQEGNRRGRRHVNVSPRGSAEKP